MMLKTVAMLMFLSFLTGLVIGVWIGTSERKRNQAWRQEWRNK